MTVYYHHQSSNTTFDLRRHLKEYVWENYPEKDLRRAMLIDINRLDPRNFPEGGSFAGKCTRKAEKRAELRLIANGYFRCTYAAWRVNPGMGTWVRTDFGSPTLWCRPSVEFRAVINGVDANGVPVFDREKFQEWKRVYGKKS